MDEGIAAAEAERIPASLQHRLWGKRVGRDRTTHTHTLSLSGRGRSDRRAPMFCFSLFTEISFCGAPFPMRDDGGCGQLQAVLSIGSMKRLLSQSRRNGRQKEKEKYKTKFDALSPSADADDRCNPSLILLLRSSCPRLFSYPEAKNGLSCLRIKHTPHISVQNKSLSRVASPRSINNTIPFDPLRVKVRMQQRSCLAMSGALIRSAHPKVQREENNNCRCRTPFRSDRGTQRSSISTSSTAGEGLNSLHPFFPAPRLSCEETKENRKTSFVMLRVSAKVRMEELTYQIREFVLSAHGTSCKTLP